MFKALIVLGGLLCSLFAADFGKEAAFPLLDTDGSTATIFNNDIKAGESGIVIRWFDSQHSAIMANAVVTETEGDKVQLAFISYDALGQSAFPVPKLLPRKNDIVILRRFYDRALLIAPNQSIYQKITRSYDTISWIHPDLFASYLVNLGSAVPVKRHFQGFCRSYNIGIVYFVNGTRGQAYDCKTFTMINEDYISGKAKPKDRIIPFYSRLGNIEKDWFEFLTTDVGDYYFYYEQLLSGQIDQDEKGILEQFLSFFENI